MSIYTFPDGYYDDRGHWQRTKFCFMDCGDRCTCKPPTGIYRLSLCEACERGDHGNCGRQSWCKCECDGAIDPLDAPPAPTGISDER